MTYEYFANTSITTTTQFNTALNELLWRAHAGNVNVSGAWQCDSDGTTPAWEANIVELLNDGGSKR
jgi:hypothetical protein